MFISCFRSCSIFLSSVSARGWDISSIRSYSDFIHKILITLEFIKRANAIFVGHVCFDKKALSAFPAMLLPSNEILENWIRIFGVENDTSVHQTFHKIKNKKNATSVQQKCYFRLPMILPSIYGKKFRLGAGAAVL